MIVAFIHSDTNDDEKFAEQILKVCNIDAKIYSYPSFNYVKFINKPDIEKILLFGIATNHTSNKIVLLPKLSSLYKSQANIQFRKDTVEKLKILKTELDAMPREIDVKFEEIQVDTRKANSEIAVNINGEQIGINSTDFYVTREDIILLEKLKKVIVPDKITLRKR
jgi:hypothetical protein